MKIKINDFNYHIAKLTIDELNYISNISEELNKKVPLSDVDEKILNKMVCSIIMENKLYYQKLSKENFYSEIISEINSYYNIALENEKTFSTNHYVFYEPNISYTYYKVVKYMDEIHKSFVYDETYSSYYKMLCNSIFRSIKAIIIMISTGDDVHGMSIARGLIELLAKIEFLNVHGCKEEFVLFNKINSEIQMYKLDKKYKIKDEYYKFLKDKKLNVISSNTENYLLYQWMKTEDTVIKNGTELIEYFYKEEQFTAIYKLTSEFVHEDYLMVNYNYISIRNMLKNLVCIGLEFMEKYFNK